MPKWAFGIFMWTFQDMSDSIIPAGMVETRPHIYPFFGGAAVSPEVVLASDNQRRSRIEWEVLSTDSLLDWCIKGRQEAWKEFLRRYGPLIQGTIVQKLSSLGYGHAKTDAEDIFQDVFKNLVERDCRALSSIRNRDKIDSWLCAIALNKTIDSVRRKWRSAKAVGDQGYIAEQETAYSPSKVEDSDLAEEIWDAVEQLQPDEQLLVKWHYIHDLKYREMADLANIPINTVSSRLFRIKRKLFRHLSRTEIS
jgi:RNA polymerase sigma-70 factor (ECF subfamily)